MKCSNGHFTVRFTRVPRSPLTPMLLLAVALAACHRAPQDSASPADVRPFGSFANQHIVIVPTSIIRLDTAGWVQSAGGPRPVARQLDSAIALQLESRGLASGWILPAGLQKTYERNRSYAQDPYQLATQQLRSLSFKSGERYGEPLSSQLRTMIALEEDARYVVIPVELKFEKDGAMLRGVLRLALLDPRAADARWVGEVKGVPASALAPALSSVSQKFADLFAAP